MLVATPCLPRRSFTKAGGASRRFVDGAGPHRPRATRESCHNVSAQLRQLSRGGRGL
jgi:hypothetical protein